MHPSHEPELERLIHRELRRLPLRSAPQSLLPRVLARIEARARQPWYRRLWTRWPTACQGVFLGLLAAVAWGLTCGLGEAWTSLVTPQLTARLSPWLSPLDALGDGLATAGKALFGSLRKPGQMALLAGLAVVAAAYLSCLGAGTALYRLANAKSPRLP